MSMKLDAAIREIGTRFRIFPQPSYLAGFEHPETVWVSVPPDKIEHGPADNRMYVIDAIDKSPYDYPYLPPHQGASNPKIAPQDGHFDHLDVESREFKAAHMYAIVRRVLDIWEDYIQRTIEWHFRLHYDRMELIPLIKWDNAHSGYGFLEFGFGRAWWGGIDDSKPYCLNFDVLAHELGHSFVFSEVGVPTQSTLTNEYGGFHEAAGDIVAIISALHFELVVSHLLGQSSGNLFTANELGRIGELSASQQIRKAFNWERMSTVGTEPHDLSKPLTGAIFDILVEVFQKELVEANLISQELADRSYHGPDEDVDDKQIQADFEKAYDGEEEKFKICLLKARDYLGGLFAKTLETISPDNLTYAGVGSTLLSLDANITGGKHQETIRDCFAWREITFPSDNYMLRTWSVTECAISVTTTDLEELICDTPSPEQKGGESRDRIEGH